MPKLEGYNNDEIAPRLGRVRFTIGRKLQAIRRIWYGGTAMSAGEWAASFERDLTSTAIERLDAACDGFEEAWKAGRRPRIEDVLEGVPRLARTGLLRDLLLLDLAYRRLAGERPTPVDYLVRFPDYEATIRAAFDAAATNDPPPMAPGAARIATCYSACWPYGRTSSARRP